jgi:hypothetical protein
MVEQFHVHMLEIRQIDILLSVLILEGDACVYI